MTTDEYVKAVIQRAKDGRFEDCLEFLSIAVAELDSLSQILQCFSTLGLLSSHYNWVPLRRSLGSDGLVGDS